MRYDDAPCRLYFFSVSSSHCVDCQIEMVGRLVQHEQLGLREQQPRQAQPRLFTAGEQTRGLLARAPLTKPSPASTPCMRLGHS